MDNTIAIGTKVKSGHYEAGCSLTSFLRKIANFLKDSCSESDIIQIVRFLEPMRLGEPVLTKGARHEIYHELSKHFSEYQWEQGTKVMKVLKGTKPKESIDVSKMVY